MEKNVDKAGLYLARIIAGNVGVPGAPILHLSLLVNAERNTVVGQGRHTQAIQGPWGDIQITDITGEIRYTGLGEYTKIVYLQGTAVISASDPDAPPSTVPFSASFAINNAWKGIGGWTIGDKHFNDLPVCQDK